MTGLFIKLDFNRILVRKTGNTVNTVKHVLNFSLVCTEKNF